MAEEQNVPILSRLRAPEGAVRKKLRVGRGIASGHGKNVVLQGGSCARAVAQQD